MRDKHLDRLVEKAGSKYTLVVAVAKRAQQLRAGAVPVVETKSRNPVTIALAEIAHSEVLVNPEEIHVEPASEPASSDALDVEDLDIFSGVGLDGEIPDGDLSDVDLDEELE